MTSVPGDSERATQRQVGALPFRKNPDGGFAVLLVTSRESRRWVIPKGWPMKGRKPYEAAAREAYEEAGVIGHIGKRPLGFFLYEKRLKSRDSVLCQVKVFPLEVRKQLKRWPEQSEREQRWFAPSEAADLVAEPGLAAIIRAALKRDDPHVA
ncbi:NUDIX hydrolase [Methylobacterium durans]|uniref:NUDIX hydrolase n=1 Tax=Methylobacterium durans TaxID=2202825 RepID=UPI002B002102|nr:NUDIX hydrolase [Methylobacterium durans]MEA1830913.1 NUDIX hydrolase [Methylobacterium durans]